MSKLAMIITSTAKPGKRDDIHRLYRDQLATRAESNDDQEVVVWCDDQGDEDTFHLFEIYRNEEAFRDNASSQFFADYMATAGPLLAAQPEVRMATPRWSTGV